MLAPWRNPFWAVASTTPKPARPIPCNSQLEDATLSQVAYSGEEGIIRDLRQKTAFSARLCGDWGGVQSTIFNPDNGFLSYGRRTTSVHTLSTLRVSRQHRFRRLIELVQGGQTGQQFVMRGRNYSAILLAVLGPFCTARS